MALESTLLREVGSLSRCLHSFMDVRFRQYHLQRGQFIFLTRICEHPGIGQAALTAMCCVDKGTTSKAVRKLRESQYITCEADETDGRAVKLYPTSAGNPYMTPSLKRKIVRLPSAFVVFQKKSNGRSCCCYSE